MLKKLLSINCLKCRKKKKPLIKNNLDNTRVDIMNVNDSSNPPIIKAQNNITKIEKIEIKVSDPNNNTLISEPDLANNNDKNNNYSEHGLNLNENIGDDEPLLKEDSPLICDYEKGKITFTRNGLINLYESLWNLDNYKKTWDKDNLTIEIRYEGTPMNDKFYIIKMIYKLNKSELKFNKDTESIMDYCYDDKIRILWDDALKLYEKYEGNNTNFITCTWGKSPIFFVSERESIDKRFRFNKDNSTYIMSTSIPLEIYPPKKDVVRFIDLINLFKIADEGEEIVFTSLNQADFKMTIPQMLINVTLPMTSKTWYVNLKKFANNVEYDKENKAILKRHDEEKE
jgi:hypothetical protein